MWLARIGCTHDSPRPRHHRTCPRPRWRGEYRCRRGLRPLGPSRRVFDSVIGRDRGLEPRVGPSRRSCQGHLCDLRARLGAGVFLRLPHQVHRRLLQRHHRSAKGRPSSGLAGLCISGCSRRRYVAGGGTGNHVRRTPQTRMDTSLEWHRRQHPVLRISDHPPVRRGVDSTCPEATPGSVPQLRLRPRRKRDGHVPRMRLTDLRRHDCVEGGDASRAVKPACTK